MRNRAVQHRPDFACTLRPGRVYRAVVVVCGETSLEELEDALVDAGFERRSLLLATANDWRKIRPKDWPDEPELEGLSANECLVRIMGELDSQGPALFPRDAPLPEGARFTLAQAWEYSEPLDQVGGDAPPAVAPRGAVDGGGGWGMGTVLLVGGAFALGTWWLSRRSEGRLDRDRNHMMRLLAQEAEADEGDRLAELLEERDRQDRAAGERELALERARRLRAFADERFAIPPPRARDAEILALLEEGRE